MRIEDLKVHRPRFTPPAAAATPVAPLTPTPAATPAAGRLKCSKCGGLNADDARKCRACNESLYVTCAACSQVNLRSRAVCRICGHHLRNSVFRKLKHWVVDRHGGLARKIALVLAVSYVSSKVIFRIAQMGGGGERDEGPPVDQLPAEPGMAAPAPAPEPEPLIVLPAAGKKK